LIAAIVAGVRHLVYVSLARPAPVALLQERITVRLLEPAEGE
jgi:hypothetical protein